MFVPTRGFSVFPYVHIRDKKEVEWGRRRRRTTQQTDEYCAISANQGDAEEEKTWHFVHWPNRILQQALT
jgi:hypothetical protein